MSVLDAVRNNALIVALCVVLTPAAAVIATVGRNADYSATASLVLRDQGIDEQVLKTAPRGTADPARQGATDVQIVAARPVAALTARRLGLTTAYVRSRVQVSGLGRSDVASVTASDANAHRAVMLANAYADAAVAFRRDQARAVLARGATFLEATLRTVGHDQQNRRRRERLSSALDRIQLLNALETGDALVLERATSASKTSLSTLAQALPLALLLGLAFGVSAALLRERAVRPSGRPGSTS